jgi:hypothetical protein
MATIRINLPPPPPPKGTDLDRARAVSPNGGNMIAKLGDPEDVLQHSSTLSDRVAEWVERYDRLLADTPLDELNALLWDCPLRDLPKRGALELRILDLRRAALEATEVQHLAVPGASPPIAPGKMG